MLVKKYFEDPKILHVGTTENRAYYIPYSDVGVALEGNRVESDRLLLLNGEWNFKYFKSIYDMKEEFYAEGYDCSNFDKIPVPAVWQNYGYDKHQYTNVKFPFPYDPPYVPIENPCGAYVRKFEVDSSWDGMRKYINFEGVDSCFYIWINGNFVGYSQVSHSTSEFEISDFIRSGINSIAVLVLKWCDGSYFEDQDKFRMSGIFRDVYLLARPKAHIRDFFVNTELKNDYTQAQIKVNLDVIGDNVPVKYSLLNKEYKEIAVGQAESNLITIDLQNPSLWNAENPYLYTLVFETGDEIIVNRVGLREIKVVDAVVYVNGVNIKFRGVNRHDSSPFTGAAVNLEHMLQDLALMKQHNINAIRTSHYPNAPVFLELCDKYGFYVIAEADIECHGVCTTYGEFEGKYSTLASDPIYAETVLDRVQRSVIRDKNHACVVIWSLGNESGYGCIFEAAGRWVKSYDDSRLLHYESAHYVPAGYKPDRSMLDLYSRMYASCQDINNYFEGTLEGEYKPDEIKPFIQCEYSHAMGNGPGDIEEYFELTQKYDGYVGGFIWEWCDHAIYVGKTVEGKAKYFYGGDFGEFPHDGNFCMDGLVYPDRTPHTGLLEYKNIIRPARIVESDTKMGEFTVRNMLDFTNLKDYLYISYQVTQDGAVICSGIIDDETMLDIAPHQQKVIKIEMPIVTSKSCYIMLELIQKTDMPFTKKGHSLGFQQISIAIESGAKNKEVASILASEAVETSTIAYTEDDGRVIVRGSNFKYIYNKFTGIFDELILNNSCLIEKPMEYNIWRAPTDNDRTIREKWQECGYDRTSSRAYCTSVSKDNQGIQIQSSVSISATYIQKILSIDATWHVNNDGTITADMKITKAPITPFLPRFGIRMFMPKSINKVEYFGYGPYESYNDKHRASYVGRFEAGVKDMHEDYIKPQENGSHWGCQYVKLVSEDGIGVAAANDTTFSFNASYYTQEELTSKMHNFELEESDFTVLCLDCTQSGIGSNSCGPELAEKYRLDDLEFNFNICIKFSNQ